jgi:pectin methylesterase-like acyl-CoA thioesterase
MRSVSLIVFAVAVALVTAAAGESAPKGSLCVGGPHCYSTVQAAVDAASDGDTILVGPGRFTGGVAIKKSLTLAGVDAHASMISAADRS